MKPAQIVDGLDRRFSRQHGIEDREHADRHRSVDREIEQHGLHGRNREFGRLTVEIENVPSENPRTGKLSYLSAIAMLRELGASAQIGN